MNKTAVVETPRSRLPGLDALRFAAAGAVLLYHFLYAGPLGGYYWGLPAFGLFSFGWLGVDVFFVISGLVISITANGRGPFDFTRARFLRLYPAFALCSLAGALLWVTLDGPIEFQLSRWLADITLFPKVFGYSPRLSVYWTLTVEVTFYTWVALLLAFGLWQRRSTIVILGWLFLSLANELSLRNGILGVVLITPFAGHFALGIVLYRLMNGDRSPALLLISSLSWLLMAQYEAGYYGYLKAAFDLTLERWTALLVPPIVVALVYTASTVAVPKNVAKLATAAGLASYPLYLIHTDIGFWPRAFLDRVAFRAYPDLTYVLTPPVLMALSTIASVVLAFGIATFVEPMVREWFAVPFKWVASRRAPAAAAE